MLYQNILLVKSIKLNNLGRETATFQFTPHNHFSITWHINKFEGSSVWCVVILKPCDRPIFHPRNSTTWHSEEMLSTNLESWNRDRCKTVATNSEMKNISLSLLQIIRIGTVTGSWSVTLSKYAEVNHAVHNEISHSKWLQAISLNMYAYLCMKACVCVFLHRKLLILFQICSACLLTFFTVRNWVPNLVS